jgi:hypothetical protein
MVERADLGNLERIFNRQQFIDALRGMVLA